jgi:hypothetical protein
MTRHSKWMDWQPAGQNIEKRPGNLPTKPTEPSFVGSVGTPPGPFPIFKPAELDPLDDLRQPFVAWFDARLRLDPRSSTSLAALHADLCGWLSAHRQAALTSEQFLSLLHEFCLDVREIAGEQFVLYVAFQKDGPISRPQSGA